MKEYLTKENKEALEIELKELSGPKRKIIITAIEYAKSLGDLSENAEYHIAREDQGKLEERIRTIENVLKNAVVVDRPVDGTINIGSTVVIQKEGESNTRTFILVGSEETDMLSGKISYKSPIGAALYGKKKADMDYEIISVS
jgi:transcription elongation factor GreA